MGVGLFLAAIWKAVTKQSGFRLVFEELGCRYVFHRLIIVDGTAFFGDGQSGGIVGGKDPAPDFGIPGDRFLR